MATTRCSLCNAPITIDQEDAIRFSQIHCPECGVILTVTSEDPLTVEWISGRWDYEDLYGEDMTHVRHNERKREPRQQTKERRPYKRHRSAGDRNAKSDMSDMR